MKEEDVFGTDHKIFSKCMLEQGYFPENLPPVFVVSNLHNATSSLIDSKEYISKKPTEPSSYNASKRGGSRRNFEIPNPTSIVDSAIFFSEHRSEIFEHFQSTDDSLSVPKFDETGRPARITTHSEFHRIRRQKLSTSRFVVRTDISRYFHSIYTHSIPWALHGKPESKKDRNLESETIFGNRLDYIIRQAQDGQTVGIPVGPDFSRFTSEIIGKAIDAKFREAYGDQCILIRHVDDIFIGADNYDQAAQLLNGIRDAIRKFQLDINDNKTSIVATNLDLEPFWPVRIRREIENFSGNNPKAGGSSTSHDFVYFLDEIVRIANSENDDGVVKYALRKMDEFNLWDDYWHLVEPFLVRSAINFPHCWDYIARIVSWRKRTQGINKALWNKVVSKSLSASAASGHDSEVCWALWLAKEAGFSVGLETQEAILEKCGALSVTLALDVFTTTNADFKYPKAKLLDRLGDRPILGNDWLLSYEADRLFDYKLKTKNLNPPTLFEELYKNNVEFYDPDAFPAAFPEDAEATDVKFALGDISSQYDEDYDDIDMDDYFDDLV